VSESNEPTGPLAAVPVERPRAGVLGRPIRAVNIGLELFAETLEREAHPVVRVECEIVGLDGERLARILAALR
jgi:uncharacterized protein YegL